MVPKIKKKYEYGATIFILTFNLVAISGVRIDEIIKVASDRFSSIFIGFLICVFISLFIFPIWAGDELHNSLVSKFEILGHSLEDCFRDSMPLEDDQKGSQTACTPCMCSSVLYSKTTDEAMANFAKWETWHGKFGFYYPWNKYLKIGELLRELTSSIISLKECLDSKPQNSTLCSMIGAKERYAPTLTELGCTLRELGDNIYNMKQCKDIDNILEIFENMKTEICSPPICSITVDQNRNVPCEVSLRSILLLLLSVMDKMEEVVKEVEELGKTAGFAHP